VAKRRKGAKKVSASRSKPSKAVPPKKRKRKPVSPVPRKRAPAKRGRSAKELSRAARRGWETRRRENPLRWGSKAIAKRREKLQSIVSAERAIEREWKELERKAIRQKREADKAGGVHPSISRKLKTLETIEQQIADMKVNIRRFNSPSPDRWELEAYILLEKFVTLHDMGGDSEDIKKAHRKWYQAKMAAREHSKDWPAWMAMIGSVLGLPMHGKFSIDSFVTS
jgi:hypothetical protein